MHIGRSALALALAIPLLFSSAGAEETAPRPFAPATAGKLMVYRGVTLIDGRGGPAQPDMAVITDGATITQVFPSARLDTMRLANAEFVDVQGGYMIPGLIDSHQHMATPPNRAQAQAQMRRDLYGGITAVRDMADDLRAVAEYARETRLGEVAGPDIYYAALFAGPDFFDDPRTQAASEGIAPGAAPWMQAITAKTDMPRAVARAAGTSAIAIKLYDNLKPAEVRHITTESHRQGLRVWAHGMVFPTPPSDVVAAGVDVISHTCYLAYQVSNPRPLTYKDRRPVEVAKLANGDNPQMAALFRAMKTRGIVLDATIRVYAEYDRRLAANPAMKPKPSRNSNARLIWSIVPVRMDRSSRIALIMFSHASMIAWRGSSTIASIDWLTSCRIWSRASCTMSSSCSSCIVDIDAAVCRSK